MAGPSGGKADIKTGSRGEDQVFNVDKVFNSDPWNNNVGATNNPVLVEVEQVGTGSHKHSVPISFASLVYPEASKRVVYIRYRY